MKLINIAKDSKFGVDDFKKMVSKLKSDFGYDILQRFSQIRGCNDVVSIYHNSRSLKAKEEN